MNPVPASLARFSTSRKRADAEPLKALLVRCLCAVARAVVAVRGGCGCGVPGSHSPRVCVCVVGAQASATPADPTSLSAVLPALQSSVTALITVAHVPWVPPLPRCCRSPRDCAAVMVTQRRFGGACPRGRRRCAQPAQVDGTVSCRRAVVARAGQRRHRSVTRVSSCVHVCVCPCVRVCTRSWRGGHLLRLCLKPDTPMRTGCVRRPVGPVGAPAAHRPLAHHRRDAVHEQRPGHRRRRSVAQCACAARARRVLLPPVPQLPPPACGRWRGPRASDGRCVSRPQFCAHQQAGTCAHAHLCLCVL